MASGDFLIGVLIGLILTLTGAGGSIVASPLLVYFGAVSINDATGLTLATVCISAACLSFYGYCRGMFPVRTVAVLAVSGMLTAPFARLIVEQLDSRLMGVLFASMALFFSVYYLFGDYISDVCKRNFKTGAEQSPTPPGAVAMFAWGSLAGGLSGFFGIGGGIVLMPVVMKVLSVPASRGVYYCLPVICLITSTGALTFIARAGQNILDHLLPLAAGALAGSVLGLFMLPMIDPRLNRRILGVTVLLFGCIALYQALT